jgi:hypothetical protein
MEHPAEICVTAPDGGQWGHSLMKFVILIRVARSMLILAWSDEHGPGVLSRRLAALRFWPSCQQRRTIR